MALVARLDMDIRTDEDPLDRLDLAGRVERIDCYDLADVDLAAYAGLVVPAMIDQEHMGRRRAVIDDYLEAGGVVVFGGHLHRHWLAGASAFVPLAAPSRARYEVVVVADHPVFRGVDAADLTYRRGVAGFFARGHHPPPEGAEILTRLAGGQPATYVDAVSTPGTILVQTSCDLLGYAGGPETTAARIPGQLLDWIVAESCRRRASRSGVAR